MKNISKRTKKMLTGLLALVLVVAAISNSLVLPFADSKRDYNFYIMADGTEDAEAIWYNLDTVKERFGEQAQAEYKYLMDLYYDNGLDYDHEAVVTDYMTNLEFSKALMSDTSLMSALKNCGVVATNADAAVKSNWPAELQKYRPMDMATTTTPTPSATATPAPAESNPPATTAEPTPDSTYATEVDKNGNPMSKDEVMSLAADYGTATFVGKNNVNNLPVYQRVYPDGRATRYISIVNGSPRDVERVQDGVVPGTDTPIYRYDVTFLDGKDRWYIRENGKNIPYDKVLPSFTDVHETDWFYEAVTAMADNGIVNGYGNGTFQPNKPLTIGEMAALICRIDSTVKVRTFAEVCASNKDGLNGMKSPNYGERDWDAPTSWAHDYIWAVWEGGYTHWDPEAYDVPVMRGEAMKIAVEFATRMQAYSDINWRDNGTWYPTRQAERTHVIKDYDSIQYMIPDFFPSAISYDEKEVLGTVSGTYSNGTQKGARHGIEFNRPGDIALTGTNYSGWEFMPCDCSDYDLNEHFWTAGDVLVAYQLGIVHGVDTAGTSGAHNSITRAEFCQMLYNMGIKDTQTVNCWYVTKPEGGVHTGLKENGEEVLERSQGVPPQHF